MLELHAQQSLAPGRLWRGRVGRGPQRFACLSWYGHVVEHEQAVRYRPRNVATEVLSNLLLEVVKRIYHIRDGRTEEEAGEGREITS